jgi:hypothetical protein
MWQLVSFGAISIHVSVKLPNHEHIKNNKTPTTTSQLPCVGFKVKWSTRLAMIWQLTDGVITYNFWRVTKLAIIHKKI